MLSSASINFYCLIFFTVFLVSGYPSIKIVSAIPAVAAILQAMFFRHTEDPNCRNTCLWSICIVPNSLFKRKYHVLFQDFSFPCHLSKTASTWATSCSLLGMYRTYREAKMLFSRPPRAYSAVILSLSVQRMMPMGGLSSGSLTSAA